MIGWLFETIEVLIHFGKLTDRGILFISYINSFPIIWGLPFIMIYGLGGAILIYCFKPLAKNPFLLFFIGMITMTLFEYLTSFIAETLWNQKLWDYSNQFMNLGGRICLRSSIAWGVLSLIAVKFLGPLFHNLYNKIKFKKALHIIIILLVIYIFIAYYLRPIIFPNMI